jgi:dTDP-4-dehydrorhamnose reductase
MKVAIFGASGLVGRSMRHLLSKVNIEWVGTYNKHPFPNGYFLEKTNVDALEQFFTEHNVTHCINCIAERNVDLCEKDFSLANEINALFPGRLAFVCKQLSIYFLHISTDYVFDGSSPPYSPSSVPNPIQAYGKTKTEAENLIKQLYPESCIVRVPVLYTQNFTSILETAVTMIGKKVMDKTQKYKEDNFFIRRPVFIDDLASFLIPLLENKSSGIHHFFNPVDKVTKYEIAKKIGKFLEIDTFHIDPQQKSENNAGRPYDTQLIDNYNRKSFELTTLDEGIRLCFEKFKHPMLVNDMKPSESVFFLLDLDGTLLDTDKLHYESYKEAFSIFGYNFLNWDEYERLVSLEEYCRTILGDSYDKVKEQKNKIFLGAATIEYMPGAERFLEWILQTEQNFVVVTNTSRQTVAFYKEKLPLLHKITQWITRDDVNNPKPNPEPYKLAKERFWKGETFCIGVENTESGYESIRSSTDSIYIVCKAGSYTYKHLYTKDVYFISNWNNIFTKIN